MLNRLLALLAASAIIVLLYAAATARTRPVLLCVSPDPALVRPRKYCVMNPFRDRTPERVADRFLTALRNEDRSELRRLNYAKLENEARWPIRSWRIGSREDRGAATELMYWVRRGNGYPVEESVFVTVRNGQVVQFAAIY